MILSLLQWDTPFITAIEKLTGEKIIECRTRDAALKAIPEAEIIVTVNGGGLPMDEELLNAAQKLRLVLTLSAGVERIPVRTLQERQVAVCNAKGAHAVSIAEYILGAMLAFSHGLTGFIRHQSDARWQPAFGAADLAGQTLLIVGTGHIGRETARKARAFDMNIVGLRRHAAPTEYFDRVEGVDRLQDVLPAADFVVLAAPMTPETRHMFGSAEFARMKSSALFINISRGDTVDEDALLQALRDKIIAGAALDVFHTEPLPPDSPFWTMENVLVTPHTAGLTKNAEQKTIELIADNIKRFRAGQPLVNRIGQGELY
jgi:D-2-hydroxyacid dehydrogenase (NADP+)